MGAPRGAANGNFVDGDYNATAKAQRKADRQLLSMMIGAGSEDAGDAAAIVRDPLIAVVLPGPEANTHRVHPATGTTNREWHERLARALGTASDAFVEASLEWLLAAGDPRECGQVAANTRTWTWAENEPRTGPTKRSWLGKVPPPGSTGSWTPSSPRRCGLPQGVPADGNSVVNTAGHP